MRELESLAGDSVKASLEALLLVSSDEIGRAHV